MENQRLARAKKRALWKKETKLQQWNNSRNQLLRALCTWHRLRHLTDLALGSRRLVDGRGDVGISNEWMQRLAQKRKRMNAAAKLRQVKSFPTVAACACRND